MRTWILADRYQRAAYRHRFVACDLATACKNTRCHRMVRGPIPNSLVPCRRGRRHKVHQLRRRAA